MVRVARQESVGVHAKPKWQETNIVTNLLGCCLGCGSLLFGCGLGFGGCLGLLLGLGRKLVRRLDLYQNARLDSTLECRLQNMLLDGSL
jgi:hypothetical protein